MNLRHLKGIFWRLLDRCYYCGHKKETHQVKNIRECMSFGCDCFGFDTGK